MNRIKDRFAELRRKREKALIAYLTVGFPTLRRFSDLARTAQGAGVDILELGVPFSDPLADGRTVQAASEKALRQGVSLALVLDQVRQIRRDGVQIPLVLMTYINPVLAYGVGAFFRDGKANGMDGVIVPDLPPEEAGEWVDAARSHGIDTIFLAAPTSLRERLARIVAVSTGFLYTVSLTGVTGARRHLPEDVAEHVRAIRRMTDLPICVGFGISGPQQVREILQVADGVVVGSALLDVVSKAGPRAPQAAEKFLKELKNACR